MTAKDVILHLISRLGIAGARGHIVEFAGPVARDLSIEGRLTLCNMAIEMGARTGLIAPDAKTFAWLAGRPWAPSGAEWDQIVNDGAGLISDADARFDSDLVVDCSSLEPQVTWGTDPSHVVGVDEPLPDPAPPARCAGRPSNGRSPIWDCSRDAGGGSARSTASSSDRARTRGSKISKTARRDRARTQSPDACARSSFPVRARVKRDAERPVSIGLSRGGFRMARVGMLDVRRCEWRPATPGQRVLSNEQPQFRGPSRSGRAHAPREPGDGGRRRDYGRIVDVARDRAREQLNRWSRFRPLTGVAGRRC